MKKSKNAFNKKHSIPKAGSNKIINKTCNIAKISGKAKPRIAGTILNVNHTNRINNKIENNVIIKFTSYILIYLLNYITLHIQKLSHTYLYSTMSFRLQFKILRSV